MEIETIDDVILALDNIINDAKENQNPIGYFAATYRKVTIKIKEGILQGDFDDGERMEQLDILFAKRYLDAHQGYLEGAEISLSWKIAFDQTTRYWPVVVQHLVWGINAHINLDLGIASAKIAPENAIYSLKNDFDKINLLLADLVDEVEAELSEIWPFFRYILKLLGKVDNFLINFSMKKARMGAWKFATELAAKPLNQHDSMIAKRDLKVAAIAKLVKPSRILGLIFKYIRIREKGTIAEKIEILM